MKYMEVEMPDSSRYEIPAWLIAKSFADYYQEVDHSSNLDHMETFFSVLNDDDELVDWSCNNMNWEDVSEFAIKVYDGDPIDFNEGWSDGNRIFHERED